MDGLINTLLDEFKKGKLSRRKLIETLALAAMTAYCGNRIEGTELLAAPASPPSTDRVHMYAILVNHISYVCPDYRRPRDFYRDVMGMIVSSDRPDAANPQYGQCNLLFSPRTEKPYGAPQGTPVSFVIARSRNPNPPPNPNATATVNAAGQRGGNAPAQQSRATIDHIGYTIADWDQKRVFDQLKKLGLRARGMAEPRVDSVNSYHIMDPDGYDLQICGVAMTAFN